MATKNKLFEVTDLTTDETCGGLETLAKARAYINEKRIAYYEITESDINGGHAVVVESCERRA